jgi:hypothetical protein
MNAGEPCPADPTMAAARLARQLRRRDVVETGHDQDLIAVRFQRRQDRRQLECRAGTGRRPVRHDRAVRDVHDTKAADRRRRRRGERRQHPVQERQRHRRAEPAEHGPSRKRFPRDDHGSALLI